ncbi:MAG: hypothetical protein P8O23_02190 [Opitutales bacterium]|nr:hypothetical protein [Opitutales bacterium]
MKSPKENKPSLSDLFDSKKLDIPQDDFWDGFQDQVRSKTLTSVVREEGKTRIYKHLFISAPLISIFCFSLWFLASSDDLTSSTENFAIKTTPIPALNMSADPFNQEQIKFEPSLSLHASTSNDIMPDTEVEAFTEQNFFASSLQSSFQYRILSSETDFYDDSVAPFTF